MDCTGYWSHALVSLLLMLFSGISGHGLWIHDSKFDDLLPASVSPGSSESTKFKGHCALLCKRDSTCKGFFYNEDNKQCITTSSVYLRNGGELSSTGWRYYRSTPVTCPSDGVYVLHEQSGTCFQLTDVALTWTAARDACSAAHGSLASLDTLDKEDAVMSFFRAGHSVTSSYYTGGHRPYSEWNTPWDITQPNFTWLNGQPVDVTGPYWYPGDPNGLATENSISIVYFPGDWYLVDISDLYSFFYVCEYSLF